MNEVYVLDSFAILALLEGEERGKEVLDLMRRGERGEVRLMMTWVNMGEVAYIVERWRGKREVYQVLAALEVGPVEMVEVGRELALRAGELKAKYAIAYADAFAAALAMREGGEVVTGDPEFRKLEGEVSIWWLPRGE